MGGVYQELVGEGTNDPRTCRFEERAEQGVRWEKARRQWLRVNGMVVERKSGLGRIYGMKGGEGEG